MSFITAFGGDPDRITIFGQSAGGASVGHQLIGQPSWEYFNRAMPIVSIGLYVLHTHIQNDSYNGLWGGGQPGPVPGR